MSNNLTYFILQLQLPLIIILLGVVIGFLFKQFVHSWLVKTAKKSKWEGDDVILDAIESQIIFWFFIGSLSIATSEINLENGLGFLNKDLLSKISKFFIVLLIGSITHASSKLVVGLFNIWSKGQGRGFPSTSMFTNIVKITIYLIGFLIILDRLQISIAPMLTALGVGGLAVSLALKDTLSDVFAGLHILLSKKVQPGDFIHIDSGEMGYVKNITWRNTTILERTNNIIHIPNGKLSSAIIKNYDSNDPSFSVKIPFGVSYDCDLGIAEKTTLDVIDSIQNSLEQTNKNYSPLVRVVSFGESSVDMVAYFRGNKYGDHNVIIHAFIKLLHQRFKEENIEIPYPIRTIIRRSDK